MADGEPTGVGSGRRLSIRVYWEDTDGSGIVYHAGYLRFAERARTEFLRALGFDQSTLLEEAGIAFAVRRMEIDFLSPARLDDLLEVATSVTEIGGASLSMRQRVERGGRTLADMNVKLACMDRRGRPVRLPAAFRAGFAGIMSNQRAVGPRAR